MVQRVSTVAFEGIEARAVDVQVQVAPGLPAFNIVGLPDKAVSEAKERARAALVTACCASPVRWPISTALKRSAACICPRRCPTARSPTKCGGRRKSALIQAQFNKQVIARS